MNIIYFIISNTKCGTNLATCNSQWSVAQLADRANHVPQAICAGSEILIALKPKIR